MSSLFCEEKPRYRASAKEFTTILSGYHVFEATSLPDEAMTDQASTEPETNLQQDLRNRIDSSLQSMPQALSIELSKQDTLTSRTLLHTNNMDQG